MGRNDYCGSKGTKPQASLGCQSDGCWYTACSM